MALDTAELIGIDTAFRDRADGLEIKFQQDIPQEHLDALRREHAYNSQNRAQDMHRVASVPTAVVEQWLRDGFDIHQESVPAILARLRAEHLDAFITSPKV